MRIRKPSLKSRTLGRVKKSIKKELIPKYGKKGSPYSKIKKL